MPQYPITYTPDDAKLTPAALEYLRTPEGLSLRAAVAELPHPSQPVVSDIARLRKQFPAAPLHAALVLAALQPKAAAKFPGIPYVWATPEALEQATSSTVARYKVSQFARYNPPHIFDLCAGIGGDTLALAQIAPVTAIDLSPTRTACLRYNALDSQPPPPFPIDIRTEDVRLSIQSLPRDAFIHIDPARRSAGKRSGLYADLIPGDEVLRPLFEHFPGGVIKLSPAVDFDSLPSFPKGSPRFTHLELISHNRTVVQALLWWGLSASPIDPPVFSRTATILRDGHDPSSLKADPAPITLHPMPLLEKFQHTPTASAAPAAFLYELDGAVTRAQLASSFAQQHNLIPLTSDGGYLLSPENAPLNPHLALTPFKLLAMVPFSETAVTRALQSLPSAAPTPPGPIEVKTRGHIPNLDPDHLQLTWSKASPHARTVLIFRHQKQTFAALAQRLPSVP